MPKHNRLSLQPLEDASSANRMKEYPMIRRQFIAGAVMLAIAGIAAPALAQPTMEQLLAPVKLEERRQRPAPDCEGVSPRIRAALEAAEARHIIAELRAKARIEKLIPDVSPPASNDDHKD